MVLTHSEAIRLSSEARDAGDREEAKKYSRIARDLQARATSGETKVDFYDNKSGRIRHSEAGSETYVNYMTGASERYVPISREQVKEIREYYREQPDRTPLIVPSQRVEQEGRVLYRAEPGAEPGTAKLLFPSETQQWTVTYDYGLGERRKTFETEEQATDFMASLAETEEVAIEERGRKGVFDQVGGWSRNVVARTASVNEQQQDFNSQLKNKVGFTGEKEGLIGPPSTLKRDDPYIQLRTFVQDGLRTIESPFVAATTPIRVRSERLRTEAAEEKAGFKGLSKYFAGVALAVGASAFDVATFQVRPGLVVKTGTQVGRLIADPEERKALVKTVAKDPFGFTAETLGGAYFGAKLANIGKKIITEAGPTSRAAIAEFKQAGVRTIPRTVKSIEGSKPGTIDFTQLAQKEFSMSKALRDFRRVPKTIKTVVGRKGVTIPFESRFRFPEEVVQAEFLETFRPESTFTADTTFNKKFGKWSESLVQEDFGITPTRGTTIRTAKSGYLGFGRTGADLVPMVIPEEFAVPTTIYRFRRTPLTIPSGRPGVPMELPQLGALTKTGVSVTDVLAGASIAATRPRVPTLKTKVPQIQRPETVQQTMQRFNQMQSNLTKNIFDHIGLTVGVTTTQTQPTLQITLPTTKQIPIIEAPPFQVPRQEQTPRPPPPVIVPPFLPPRPPRRPPTAILDWDPRKKKRKPSRKAGVKKAVEKRTDPLEVINWDPRKKR